MARTNKFKDITGQRFGNYVVLSHVANQKWNCRCDCGIEKVIISHNLLTGQASMCRACYHKSRIIDLTGKKFGRWTAISLNRPGNWNCRCECGAEVVVDRGNLTSGSSTQCANCRTAETNKPKHGHAPGTGISPTYQTWVSIKQRCLYETDTSYPHYGGKGICVCKGWQESFPLFLELMGERTSQRLSIDRANTDESTRHYSCGQCDECKEMGWVFHCRWATKSEQMMNRIMPARNLYTFEGKTLSLKEWAEVTGVPNSTLYARLNTYKWTVEKTLSTPCRKYDGE